MNPPQEESLLRVLVSDLQWQEDQECKSLVPGFILDETERREETGELEKGTSLSIYRTSIISPIFLPLPDLALLTSSHGARNLLRLCPEK